MWSVLFLLAAVLVATDATVVWRKFSGSGLQDKAFTQNVVFTSPAKSAVHCSVLCNHFESCETFTFMQGLCQGHALQVTSDTPHKLIAGARSFSVSNTKLGKTKTCKEVTESGVVTIYPDNVTALQVYCDQDTDGGGWTVVQRRQDASVDFNRNWTSYQKFFGDLTGNFWLGLNVLHMLTSRQRYELRVDLMMWNGTKGYATYSNFFISDSSDNYRLNLGNFTGGNAGDGMGHNRGQQFSTWDKEHDAHSDLHCAEYYHCAWWHNHCTAARLNGEYMPDSTDPDRHGIGWTYFGGDNYSHKFSEMKIRVA